MAGTRKHDGLAQRGDRYVGHTLAEATSPGIEKSYIESSLGRE